MEAQTSHGKKSPLQIWGVSAVNCARTAEPIDLPLGLWTRVGRREHKFIVYARWRQCALNATEPFMCGGDAACCQITLTTCYYYYEHVGETLLFNKFFPIVDTCLNCEDIARQRCGIVRRWRFLRHFCVRYFHRFFGSCISSEPRAAHFRPAF